MSSKMKLFYLLLGCTPKGRNIEQHDVFFGIAERVQDLVPAIKEFWQEANGRIHIDCCQTVEFADGYEVKVVDKIANEDSAQKLFFLNLGGYKREIVQEFHEQHLMVDSSIDEIIERAKETEFYKTMGFGEAASHIDNKFGVDIDDIFDVNDILPENMKSKYSIILEKSTKENQRNEMAHGYMNIDELDDFIK